MNLGTQNKRQVATLAVVGVGAVGAAIYMYTQFFPPDPAPPAAAVITTSSPAAARTSASVTRKLAGSSTGAPGTPRSAVAITEAQLDPTLHMDAMLVTESLVYTGSGRNIFSAGSAPAVVIPRVTARVRPPDPIAPVRPPVDPGPPPPSPIDLKLFGIETTANGERKGFLLHGEDVFFVASGDIVQRRYRVISIAARSIVMEDIASANRQTLPLLAN